MEKRLKNSRAMLGLAALAMMAASAAGIAVRLLGTGEAPGGNGKAQWRRAYAQLPLAFEENLGQAEDSVRFLCRGDGYSLSLKSRGAVLELKEDFVLHMGLSQSQGEPRAKAEGLLPGISNYFLGDDPGNWLTNVPQYARVRFEEVYPGIDLVYYGRQRELEYDFIVGPGADPGRIRWEIVDGKGGALTLKGNEEGGLDLKAGNGGITFEKPDCFQVRDGVRQAVVCRYETGGGKYLAFEMGAYDKGLPLVIDPVVVYSSFWGGNNIDEGNGIATDGSGNAYVTGWAGSLNVYVIKMNAAGTSLLYSTILGGGIGLGIAVDLSGCAYVTGRTTATNFPTTAGAFDATLGGARDAFVAKLNAAGSLAYSTYLGGSVLETGHGISLDAAGNAYVAGYSTSPDFPTTAGAYQESSAGGASDAFLAKVNGSGTALIFSTMLGGGDEDRATGVAVDLSGCAYLTGETLSTDFPVIAGSLQTTPGGYYEAFVAKLNGTGSGLDYSTYLGGSGFDWGYGIAVDLSGCAYVTGEALSGNFPVTVGAYDTSFSGGDEAFISKLNGSGTALAYSTFLGGANNDEGFGIAVDGAGNAFVAGRTMSANFPVTAGAYQAAYAGGFSNAFLTGLNGAGNGLLYSTYLGGNGSDQGMAVAVDANGMVFVAGHASAGNFPVTAGAYQTIKGSGTDAFIALFSQSPLPTATPTATPTNSPTDTATLSPSPTATETSSPSSTLSPTPSNTEIVSATPTATPSATSSSTVSPSPSETPSSTASPSLTPSFTDTPTGTATSTASPSFTISPTHSISPTLSPSPSVTPTPAYLSSGRGKSLLVPNPASPGQPVCLYASSAPASSIWRVYNTVGELVARLDLSGGRQCWDHSGMAPGIYFARLELVYEDGRGETLLCKEVLLGAP